MRSYAPQFIFTTTLPPMVAAGACAAIRHLKASNEERAEHRYMAAVTKHALRAAGLPIVDNPSDLLLNRHSIYIQPINDPTVPIGTERLRTTPTPCHNEAHVSSLVEALVDVWKTLGLPFTTQIVPPRRRKPLPECVYPKIRKAAE